MPAVPSIGGSEDPVQAWTRVLDRLEASLSPPHLPGELPGPGELGELPVSLVGRAERLLAAHRALEAELGAERDLVAEELRALAAGRTGRSAAPATGAGGPASLDTLA